MSFTSQPAEPGEFPSARLTKWALIAFFLYFGLRLAFYALTIAPSVPPDEVTHFALSRIFSRVLLLPVDSPETYQYGLVSHTPWLYYWLMGKVMPLNFSGLPDLTFLRLCNIPFALGTVYFAWRTLRLLTEDRLTQLLLVILMTNTIMFTFLGASVSYDNLANLLAAAAIYYLFAFFVKRDGSLLAASLLCQLAGCLTKTNLLPLALLLSLVLLANERRNLGRLPGGMAAFFRGAPAKAGLALLAIVVAFALNAQLYGGNYLKYRNISPEMGDVLSTEAALKYRTQARNIIFAMFKEGKVTKGKALEMTSGITHEGDRGTVVALIEEYDYQKRNQIEPFSPLEYIPIWIETMCTGVFGIFAHKALPASGTKVLVFLSLIVVSVIGFAREWRPREDGWLAGYLALVAGGYGVFLMYFVNYRTYLDFYSTWLSLQGRYIFPVLAPAWILCSIYLLRLVRGRSMRLALFAAAALIFICSDFPYFITHVNSGWFAWPRG